MFELEFSNCTYYKAIPAMNECIVYEHQTLDLDGPLIDYPC